MENIFAADTSHHFEMKRKASFSKLTNCNRRGIPGMYLDAKDAHSNPKNEKLWKLMETYLSTDIHSIQRGIVNHVEYTLAKTRFNMDAEACYRAAAYSVRDRLIEAFNDTSACFLENDVRRIYYLSLEFLLGRAMQNALVNLDVEDNYKKALLDIGFDLEILYEFEHDPALGNGGLGRLAACFLDSMATCNIPGWGYGIRYTYGIFEQKIINGYQVEHPDYWLVMANPWEIERADCTYAVRFYGHVADFHDAKRNRQCKRWTGGEIVQAVAYDNPIPGFDTYNVINLRLWKACPGKEFDFHLFNIGQYMEAVKERQRAEYISAVLYPNDNTSEGKELRLKQQYFFVCATIQDCLRRFKKAPNKQWRELPEKMQMQLNDTHPTIAIPELMRVLIDVEGLEWTEAYTITKQCFNYTNHTVLPEALERWPASLIEKLLPRHLLIINDINFHFLTQVQTAGGFDGHSLSRMSIYEEGDDKKIRMANLAVICSKHVNGVAAIHSQLVKTQLFPEFVKYYDRIGQRDKFLNVTNGVTPRRWIHCANPALSHLFSRWVGSDSWLKDMDLLKRLGEYVENAQFVQEWAGVKLQCKEKLAAWVESACGVTIDPETMLFDVQVKRIHEYKRQLLNGLYIVHRYLTIKKMSENEKKNLVPRACMIGGKAAPGYMVAKTIIRLFTALSAVINNDESVNQYLKVIFLPNYNVSNAQTIIPASDISQHISTAGTEASGTSNMKFVMNGGLIIGTLDGANIEIREEGGEETMFVFGVKEHEVQKIRDNARNGKYPIDSRLQEVMEFIRSGKLAGGDHDAHNQFCGLVDRIRNNGYGCNGDYYLLCHDFPDYCRAQKLVDETYKRPNEWWKLSIKAAINMGKFSSDRSIRDYVKNIWGTEPCERPIPEFLERKNSFPNDDVCTNNNVPHTNHAYKTGAAPIMLPADTGYDSYTDTKAGSNSGDNSAESVQKADAFDAKRGSLRPNVDATQPKPHKGGRKKF